MFGFEYPARMPIGRVCLEVSLKPFGLDMSDEGIGKTCQKLFDGWRELIGHAQGVSVLMWTSDGSEILEYNGDMSSTFDWARYIGIGNPKKQLPDFDPNGDDLHSRPVLYMDNPPEMNYYDLKRIIAALKRVGRESFNLDVEVGETFDPGPEFAYSDFKFHRHPELNRGSMMDSMWIHCAGELHADTCRYAAYPDGIPEGLPFGRFLGEQFRALCRDVGFDYIWLSNGFGFSLQSWAWKGELFDGKEFNNAGAGEVRESIETFWREFTAAVGDLRIETRGSNLTMGMDVSAHGCPVDAIYRYRMVAPPNSPWAALNYRFGLELAGYLSRIAHLPEQGYLFRYYPHDPWWHNSPWFDRYDRMPNDIYLPLTDARMDRDGSVTPPAGISFLSADDSYGHLPRRCPDECIPYILDAYSHYPDEPGLVTWLYPFESYIQLGLREGKMSEMFMDDWLIENAIDQGLPLNTVVADDFFAEADKAPYRGKVLVSPVPHKDTAADRALTAALESGIPVLLYGNPAYASDEVRNLLGVREAEPISGGLEIETNEIRDQARDREVPKKLRHVPLVSNGPITEIGIPGNTGILYPVTVRDPEGKQRVYASFNPEKKLAWVRGSFPHDETGKDALPWQLDKNEYFPVASLLRGMLEYLGVTIRFEMEDRAADLPVIHNSMNRNALYMTGYAKDTTVRMRLRYPQGAPLLEGMEGIAENGGITYNCPKWWHARTRMFITQRERSVVGVARRTAEHPARDERLLVTGLKDAAIVFTAPESTRLYVFPEKNAHHLSPSAVELKWSEDKKSVTVEHLTGNYYFSWQSDTNPGCMLFENQMHPKKVTETRR